MLWMLTGFSDHSFGKPDPESFNFWIWLGCWSWCHILEHTRKSFLMWGSHRIYSSLGLPCVFTVPAAFRACPFPMDQQQCCPNPSHSFPEEEYSLPVFPAGASFSGLSECSSLCILLVPTLPTASLGLGELRVQSTEQGKGQPQGSQGSPVPGGVGLLPPNSWVVLPVGSVPTAPGLWHSSQPSLLQGHL